jgi:phosphoglycolate phosphatase
VVVSVRLVLFDIDGTLVLTGRAGVRAMNRAFETVVGVADGFRDVPMAGRTDRAILADALVRHGIAIDDALLDRLSLTYFEVLEEEILQPGPRKGVLPGVRALLDALTLQQDCWLGLLTGNFAVSARIKLAHFDLWRYFGFGAFADDSADRNALVPVALERALRRGSPRFDPRDVLVVGDTPYDVECAKVVGARAVGVATGGADPETLRAVGADVVFEDLSDTLAVLEALGD